MKKTVDTQDILLFVLKIITIIPVIINGIQKLIESAKKKKVDRDKRKLQK